jgi:hypothetical protein
MPGLERITRVESLRALAWDNVVGCPFGCKGDLRSPAEVKTFVATRGLTGRGFANRPLPLNGRIGLRLLDGWQNRRWANRSKSQWYVTDSPDLDSPAAQRSEKRPGYRLRRPRACVATVELRTSAKLKHEDRFVWVGLQSLTRSRCARSRTTGIYDLAEMPQRAPVGQARAVRELPLCRAANSATGPASHSMSSLGRRIYLSGRYVVSVRHGSMRSRRSRARCEASQRLWPRA